MDTPGDDDPDVSGNVFTAKSKYEPDEFDPDSLGPSPPKPSDADFQSPAASLFVKLVVVFNVALLALSLGPMLAYFRGQVTLGSRIFLVGVVLFTYGTYRYVKFTRRDDGTDGDDESADGADQSDATDQRDATEQPDATDQRDATDHNG